jgi:hypothetical protein
MTKFISPRSVLVLVVVAALMGACTPDTSSPPVSPRTPGPPTLTWLGEFTRPAGTVYPSLPDSRKFGELSGLALDASSGQWISVLDDRDGSRVAWLTVEFSGGRLSITPTRLMPLRAGPGVPERVATQADLEAIAALPDGTFLMSEEGHIAKGEIWQPAMLHVTRDGLVTDIIEYPSPFQIRQDQTRGVRSNLGFESLTRLPNGHVVAGLEQPLVEDGDTTSFDHGGHGRLIEFMQTDGVWRAGRQWTYPIDPTPRVEGFDGLCDGGENGLTELLALSDTTLLSMERACVRNTKTNDVANSIQIFWVELDAPDSATVRKALVLDLGTLAPRLSPALAHLDNFEGMAFGPPAASGGRTLLIVSDDNFRKTQRTSFLLFGLQ